MPELDRTSLGSPGNISLKEKYFCLLFALYEYEKINYFLKNFLPQEKIY